MIRTLTWPLIVSVFPLLGMACGIDLEGAKVVDRERALEQLQHRTGAPVQLEVNELGVSRVLTMTPQFPVTGRAGDPADAARAFLAAHHDAFQLDAAEAADFQVARIDVEPTGLRHVTLQRTYDGIPVFQGAISVHMDARNGVFRALGDDFYRIAAPTNRRMLTPADAARAAGDALGVHGLAPVLAAADGPRTTFQSAATLDPIAIEPRIFQVAPGDSRFAYQATLSWLDDTRTQRYELALIDAADGSLLARHSLVNTIRGRVFVVSPGAAPSVDTRSFVTFDDDWCPTHPKIFPPPPPPPPFRTLGNNVISATDLDRNNTVGANEIQPVTDASGSFDFPFSPLADAANYREAAVTNAFYFANVWHDRTYALGFTEAAGNFQADNFGRGGAEGDELQQDVQDGSGVNNANFATPPDGQKPRMQLFLFNLKNGNAVRQDSAFDPSVVFHEHTHGLSNRLVGAGSLACLGGIQSGGMGEGWSDWLAGSLLDDPVMGAYVTGNATTGIRRASMANSPFTYANIKDGTMAEVHDAGEVWAATLWDIRKVTGAAVANQLVVSGMKLTPCNPTMLQARDAIFQADANLFGGANHCNLSSAFAHRLMGPSASSPNHNSTSQIVTADDDVPPCGNNPWPWPWPWPRRFLSPGILAIPDNNPIGTTSTVNFNITGPDIQRVTVDVNITHTFRGDLVIQVISPAGQVATLSNREGGSADNFIATGRDITSSFTRGSPATGTWRLVVRDLAALDTGTINSFRVAVTSTN